MSHELQGFACLNWCRISFHQQYGMVKFFFELLLRGQEELSAGQKFLLLATLVPSGCLLKHPPAGAPFGTSCQQITVCNRWVSGECIIPTGKKTPLKSNHAHFAAIFLYISRKLLPFIIFTKDLILYAWMLSLLLALLPPKTNKKKEGQNIYRPAKAFQICKATDVVSKVQNRRQP